MNAQPEPNSSNNHPLQEIRFTRNGQAIHFFMLGLLLICVSVGLYLVSLDIWSVTQAPLLDHWRYALIPLPFAALSIWAGIHLAKHAYMIFSPVGIELFPFFFPSRNMEVLYWSEVEDLDLTPDGKMMEVTMLSEGEHKVFVAIAPLTAASQQLLGETIAGVRKRRQEGEAS